MVCWLLVAEKNSLELADALEKLLTDKTFARLLSMHARETVVQEFDSAQTTQQLLQQFNDCMAGTSL